MINIALEREILDETGIVAFTKELIAIRISNKDWWAIFSAKYISGESTSNGSNDSKRKHLSLL
ncbi:MAG: hypothetical protein PHI32_14270 [Dysgonamonadaceae bacterium]|nr:hypothetical protein [Dysgonamonadaceae bacterium]